jgi:hypothetical protein
MGLRGWSELDLAAQRVFSGQRGRLACVTLLRLHELNADAQTQTLDGCRIKSGLAVWAVCFAQAPQM